MSELILGAGGMLARGLAALRPHATALGVAELDVTDASALARAIVPGVSVVWNAAADTRVDLCESDPGHLAVNDGNANATATNAKERTTPRPDQIDRRNGRRGRPYGTRPKTGAPAPDPAPFRSSHATNGTAQATQSARSLAAARSVSPQGPAALEKSPPSVSPATPTCAKRETKTRTVPIQATRTATASPFVRGPLAAKRRTSPVGSAASSPVKNEVIEKES